jgi:DNA-binding SARP family transcriptional activator
MEFALLGPLTVSDEGRDLQPARAKQRALLAVLLLHANEAVSADWLVEALWGEQPPASAANALQGHVSALRKLLGPSRIETSPAGYRLRLGAGELDLDRFERLLTASRTAPSRERRSALVSEALALFRGEPLADLRYETFLQPDIARLEELRLLAVEERAEAELELGHHAELVPELRRLVAEHPLSERLRGQLMLALYRSGRQTEALAEYQKLHRTLVDEVGIEPNPTVKELERRILIHDPALEFADSPSPTVPDRAVVLVADENDELTQLATLVGPLASSKRVHELILACLVPSDDPAALPSALVDLGRIQASLAETGVAARVASFTSKDRAADLIRLASRPEVDLLVWGLGRDVLRGGDLGDSARVLAEAPSDVALWVRRRDHDEATWTAGPVLVPFGGASHDWAALELAAWLAHAHQRPLHVLGAVGDPGSDRPDASRLVADAGLLIQRTTGVVPQVELVSPGHEGVIAAAEGGGVLVIGLFENWAQEGLGMVRWAIAKRASVPVLFVRRGVRPSGIAPDDSLTRYRWSVNQAG